MDVLSRSTRDLTCMDLPPGQRGKEAEDVGCRRISSEEPCRHVGKVGGSLVTFNDR